MPYHCRIVKEVGRDYIAVWSAQGEDEHYHRHEESITKSLFESKVRSEWFPQYVVCDRCGNQFESRPSFGSKPIWDTEDGKLHPGDMYELDERNGKPWWVVVLPGDNHFPIHSLSSTDNKPWDVTGEVPNITLRPSVNFRPSSPKGWHGWITNGLISDDLEGRRYD